MIMASFFTNIINFETFLNCLKNIFPNLILFSRLKFTLIFLTMENLVYCLEVRMREKKENYSLFIADITLLLKY